MKTKERERQKGERRENRERWKRVIEKGKRDGREGEGRREVEKKQRLT